MFRSSLFCAAVVGLVCLGSAGSASAEDVPNGVLAQMGFGGMQKMSDEQGMQVRGQGIAGVLGLGFTSLTVPGFSVATDGDSYTGLSGPTTNALATGSSQTTSQITAQLGVTIPVIGTGSLSLSLISATAGSSFAFAR